MNFQRKKTMPRYFLVTILLTMAGVCAVGKAIYTMTIDREYYMEMKGTLVKQGRTLPAKRGNILSCDGKVMAASLPQYKLYIDFMSGEKDSLRCKKDQMRRDSLLKLYIDTLCIGMHQYFPDIDPAKLKAHLLKGREAKSHCWPVYVQAVTSLKLKKHENRQISYVDYAKVNKLPLFNLKSTLNAVEVNLRKRLYGDLASRTIGYFNDSARYGIELTFDSILAGKPGTYHYEKVMDKKVKVVDKEAEDGYDVMTTIDIGMQEICEQALKEQLTELQAKLGVCIVMEVATGDIKAMSSMQRRSDGTYHEDWASAVTDLYEPGSVFKPQSFLVAFDDGYLTGKEQVDVHGGIHKFGNSAMKDHNYYSGGYGVLTTQQIIGFSSNVGVSVLIDKFYHNNPKAFVDGLHRIGSAEDLKIPLEGYKKPRIRYPGQGAYWSATTLPWMSIGYETQIAPINTINFYNGLANNGKLLRPRLVKALLKDGKVVKEYPVTVLREHMAKQAAVDSVKKCLEYVTTRGGGTRALSKDFTCAGKTGTAQVYTGQGFTKEYFISFVGYFPAENPKYTCIVNIRKAAPAYGGVMCAPVFKRVSEAIMARNHLDDYTAARDTTSYGKTIACAGNLQTYKSLFTQMGVKTSEAINVPWGQIDLNQNHAAVSPWAMKKQTMPNVAGFGLRDAVSCLESQGLRVMVKGVGRVTHQSVAAGEPIKKGQVVELTLGHASNAKSNHTAAKPAAQPKPQQADTVSQAPAATPKKEKKAETAAGNKAQAAQTGKKPNPKKQA